MARRDIESAESEPPDSQVSPVVAFVTSVTIQAVSRHMAHFDPSHPLWLVSAHVGAQGAPPFCCEPGRFGPRRSRLSGTVSLWKLSGSVCRFSHGRAILRREKYWARKGLAPPSTFQLFPFGTVDRDHLTKKIGAASA